MVFDTNEAEKNEGNVLIDRGVEFKTPINSILRFLSKKKERTWTVKQPYLGTLDHVSRLFLSIDFDASLIEGDPLSYCKEVASKSCEVSAMIIAVSVLNSKLRIKLFAKLLARYFLWHVKPSNLLKIAQLIIQINNYADFINSIRLMSVIRTTAPTLIEKQD